MYFFSTGVNAARDAALTFMVGGPETSFIEAKAVLDNMGKNVIHCGAVGNGQVIFFCFFFVLLIIVTVILITVSGPKPAKILTLNLQNKHFLVTNFNHDDLLRYDVMPFFFLSIYCGQKSTPNCRRLNYFLKKF